MNPYNWHALSVVFQNFVRLAATEINLNYVLPSTSNPNGKQSNFLGS